MTATQSEPKRAPKAIAVSKLIGGKLVTTLAKNEAALLTRAMDLCSDLGAIPEWQAEAKAADDALAALLTKCNCA